MQAMVVDSYESHHLCCISQAVCVQAGDLEHVLNSVREMSREMHMLTQAHTAMSDALAVLVDAGAVEACRQLLEWRATVFRHDSEL